MLETIQSLIRVVSEKEVRTIANIDCRIGLFALPSNSVDTIVTDPPYGLKLMSKKWDYDVPAVDIWAECLRVLKPGGYLLAFAGTRTQHRMAVRIEDAGFEIRDIIAWVYGSGFPKSSNVGKAIDKINGEVGRMHKFTTWMHATGLTGAQINAATGTFMGSHYLTDKSQPAIPTPELWAKLRPLCGDIPAWVDELVDRIAAEREVVGRDTKARSTSGASAMPTMGGGIIYKSWDITAPATDAARQWDGWGTALKPALEPITVARKPLIGTVADNVLTYGTGALNIDACRVGSAGGRRTDDNDVRTESQAEGIGSSPQVAGRGRYPANLIHDGSDEVLALFPDSAGSGGSVPNVKISGYGDGVVGTGASEYLGGERTKVDCGSGSAARFFYCAKANKRDRNEGLSTGNPHPTVKPTNLMRYLCRLVTPPGGLIVDPFAGSGSTGKAAVLEGFQFIGFELDPGYAEIGNARIEFEAARLEAQPPQPDEVQDPEAPSRPRGSSA